MSPQLYTAIAIAIVALVTWLTRALPFLIFRKRELPRTVRYLGKVLPPAIMVTLVIYCLRNTAWTEPLKALPELIACGVVAATWFAKRNLYLSIIAGTVCYMVLLAKL